MCVHTCVAMFVIISPCTYDSLFFVVIFRVFCLLLQIFLFQNFDKIIDIKGTNVRTSLSKVYYV